LQQLVDSIEIASCGSVFKWCGAHGWWQRGNALLFAG
jgi:hypothetical protein